MIFRVLRRIVSVIISAVLVLPLFACSAEKPVRDLFEAYVSEKDSVIQEKPRKDPEKKAEAPAPADLTGALAATAQAMPETEGSTQEPVRKKEVRTSVETVRSEVVSEVESTSEEEAPAAEAEDAAAQEEAEAEEEALPEPAALSAETEALQETLEGPEAAASYEEESLPPSMGGAAVSLASGSGEGHFLKLDEEGILLTLTVHETVYDFRIGSSTEGFHQYDSAFHSDEVEGGTAITLQAVISYDEPDISVSWTSAEGYGYLKYISLSIKDGVPMLVAVE